MMGILRSAVLAFSSFSKIPMPHIEWREENMRYMMCFFPVIGVVVGLTVAAWLALCAHAGFGAVLRGAGIALMPVVVTGGIHLDGFCDVVDAQSCHAEPARKREILKDPHAGAFASIAVAAYLVAYTALASEIDPAWGITVGSAEGWIAGWRVALLLGGLHVTSRCMSGFATVVFKTSSSEGMLAMFNESGRGTVVPAVLVAMLVACASAMAWASAVTACAMVGTGLMCLALLQPFARTQFGGMSGDLAGFFLQVAELAMLAAFVVVGKTVGL